MSSTLATVFAPDGVVARSLRDKLPLLIIPAEVVPLLDNGAVVGRHATDVERFARVTSQKSYIRRFDRNDGPLLVVAPIPGVLLYGDAIVLGHPGDVEDLATVPAVMRLMSPLRSRLEGSLKI
jgi:hypothetical protein